jgi:hypothetical protein
MLLNSNYFLNFDFDVKTIKFFVDKISFKFKKHLHIIHPSSMLSTKKLFRNTSFDPRSFLQGIWH